MNKIVKYSIIVAVICIAAFIFYNKVFIPKSSYKTLSPTVGSLNVEVFGIGNVGAKNIYVINAQMGGKIVSILTDEGMWVKKGDLLITMDSVDIPELLDSAKISVEKSNSELEASQRELKSLQAQKNLALVTYTRFAKLKKQSFVSQSEYDKAKADLDAISAQLDSANARINTGKIEITRAIKGVESLQVKLSRYKIYAPVDGYVVSRDAEVAQSMTPSQSILQIVDPKTVWIKAYIDEKISGNVTVGQKANITLRSQNDKIFSGYVKRIVAQSDAVTQEREVNIAFDTLPNPFYINEQAEVSIATKHFKNIVKIPSTAVLYQGENVGVWVNENGKAHFQSLEIIARGEKELGVTGVDKDAKILIATPKNKALKEGMSVR
ncbi:MAG: efflux RND transporter periplasmic adaptor subunit [Desulfocapsa sp.]|nr:efflux RND transporter periplasmic adaptor subunit [Desulfocapsa sp.]